MAVLALMVFYLAISTVRAEKDTIELITRLEGMVKRLEDAGGGQEDNAAMMLNDPDTALLYELGSKDGRCTSERKIRSINECEVAARQLKLPKTSVRNEEESGYPSGCYYNNNLWFNTHSFGSAENNSQPICRNLRKGCDGTYTYGKNNPYPDLNNGRQNPQPTAWACQRSCEDDASKACKYWVWSPVHGFGCWFKAGEAFAHDPNSKWVSGAKRACLPSTTTKCKCDGGCQTDRDGTWCYLYGGLSAAHMTCSDAKLAGDGTRYWSNSMCAHTACECASECVSDDVGLYCYLRQGCKGAQQAESGDKYYSREMCKGDSFRYPYMNSGYDDCGGEDRYGNTKRCTKGMGDCDKDEHCDHGLKCGNNNCNFGNFKDDCCYDPKDDGKTRLQLMNEWKALKGNRNRKYVT